MDGDTLKEQLKQTANDNGFLLKIGYLKRVGDDSEGDSFRTLKELNRKIKDFSLGNLKSHNYGDLINHLIDFKDYCEGNDENGGNRKVYK